MWLISYVQLIPDVQHNYLFPTTKYPTGKWSRPLTRNLPLNWIQALKKWHCCLLFASALHAWLTRCMQDLLSSCTPGKRCATEPEWEFSCKKPVWRLVYHWEDLRVQISGDGSTEMRPVFVRSRFDYLNSNCCCWWLRTLFSGATMRWLIVLRITWH